MLLHLVSLHVKYGILSIRINDLMSDGDYNHVEEWSNNLEEDKMTIQHKHLAYFLCS
jgi:hypothetical protein